MANKKVPAAPGSIGQAKSEVQQSRSSILVTMASVQEENSNLIVGMEELIERLRPILNTNEIVNYVYIEADADASPVQQSLIVLRNQQIQMNNLLNLIAAKIDL